MANKYSRIFHHISTNDLKRNREIMIEKIEEENKIKKEERTIFEIFKRDWRRELRGNRTILNIPEGMTSSNFLTTVLPAAGETAVDQVDPTASASFAPTTNMFGSGADNPSTVDTVIRNSGSGNGSTGGFDVGGDYLAFQGGSGSSRMALLQPMDATTVDTLTITAIRGTGSNGGEHPDVVGTEELFVIYKTPDMSRSSYLSQDRNQNNVGAFPDDAAIIAINQGDGTLQDYTIAIPEYARQKDVIFGLFQLGNSGSQYDHYGVTDIKFQRKAPVNVVVSLDSPEAISFVRVGTNEGDPKKRKKKVNDQLEASDQYTTKQMGKDFPGQGARLGDEASSMGAPDPFSSASFQEPDASPIGKDQVKKSFDDFQKGDQTPQVIKTPEQIKVENDGYLADLDNLLKQNDYNYADPKIIKIANKILKTDPKNEDAYFYKIGTQYQTGDMEGVAKTTDEMIKNNPDNTTGYSIRSSLRKDEGDLFGAIEDLEKVIELDPDETYYQDMKRELENESDDDVQSS